nr:serine protease inhibitor 2-like [Ipomoea trifida]
MKSLVLLFVTLLTLFVPFAFSLEFPFPPSVTDIEGNDLQLGVPYYAFSAAFILPSGLCLLDLKNQTIGCPHDVVQCSLLPKPTLGLPIIFSTGGAFNATPGAVVKESTPYTVRFPVTAAGLLCLKDTVWGLADVNPFWKFVTTDPSAAAAEFQVQREGFGYKIAYCVYIPIPRIPVCYPIGFIQDGFNRRLGLGLGIDTVQFFFTKNGTLLHNYATS